MSTPVVASSLETFPADLQAQIVHICSELGCAGPVIMVMSFDRRLDEARLSRAARLLLDAEPILGCRFESNSRRPAWRRRDDLDRQEWCVVHLVQDPEALIRQLLRPQPEHLHQTFLLHLARHPGGDTLLMWISHLLADSFATGECASVLADIYTKLGVDRNYRPEPNPAPRDDDAWMTDMTFRDVLRIFRRDVRDGIEGRGPVHGFLRDYPAFRIARPFDADFAKYRIPAAVVVDLDRAALARRCTRNDLLSAAFLRAFAEFAPQGPRAKAQVGLTVNLRSYAPARSRYATCSMVGITRVSVGPDLGATFDDTLAQVTTIIRRQKKALMGAANPLYVRALDLLSFRHKRAMVTWMIKKAMARPMSPTFSNAGRMNAAKLRFDGVAPADVGFVVFPVGLPLFLVGAVEYEGAVTLTTCFQPADLSKPQVHMLLEAIVRVLPIDVPAKAVDRAQEVA